MYACGSTTGAGAAIGAAAGAAPPHELQPEGAHESQLTTASQQLLLLHLKILASKPRFPSLLPQPLSQDGAPQGSQAAISAPQLGAAPQPEAQPAISAPQLGPAPHAGAPHGSQDSAPQLGAQADLQECLLFKAQSLALSAERIGLRGAQHELHELQDAISAPQLGAAPQPDPQGAAISAPQLGPAPQPDPQGAAISAPQDGSQTDVSQHELDAPQP